MIPALHIPLGREAVVAREGQSPPGWLCWDREGMSLPGCDSRVIPQPGAVPGSGRLQSLGSWHILPLARRNSPEPSQLSFVPRLPPAFDVTAGPAGHLSPLLPILPFLFPFPVALCRFSPSAS